MSFKFKDEDFKKIEETLNTRFNRRAGQYRAVLLNEAENRKLTIEIYPDIQIGEKTGNLVSIFTPYTHSQLHFCSGYVASDVLEEVTFFAEYYDRLSGVIVERQAGCSIVTNVESGLLSGDFTKLAPEVMLSGIALSLTEPLLENKTK